MDRYLLVGRIRLYCNAEAGKQTIRFRPSCRPWLDMNVRRFGSAVKRQLCRRKGALGRIAIEPQCRSNTALLIWSLSWMVRRRPGASMQEGDRWQRMQDWLWAASRRSPAFPCRPWSTMRILRSAETGRCLCRRAYFAACSAGAFTGIPHCQRR